MTIGTEHSVWEMIRNDGGCSKSVPESAVDM